MWSGVKGDYIENKEETEEKERLENDMQRWIERAAQTDGGGGRKRGVKGKRVGVDIQEGVKGGVEG